jgi:hypothetical protein
LQNAFFVHWGQTAPPLSLPSVLHSAVLAITRRYYGLILSSSAFRGLALNLLNRQGHAGRGVFFFFLLFWTPFFNQDMNNSKQQGFRGYYLRSMCYSIEPAAAKPRCSICKVLNIAAGMRIANWPTHKVFIEANYLGWLCEN